MTSEPLPAEVRVFLAQEVRSLLALELLILLRRERRSWTSAELTRELRATPEWTDQELLRLANRGLVVRASPGEGGTHEHPAVTHRIAEGPHAATPNVESAMNWLAASYPAHRFSIIQSLYAPGAVEQAAPSPPPPTHSTPPAVQHFADAFKIRKEHPHG